MKKILRYAPIAMAMLLMASCASKKTITDGTKLPSLPHAQTEKSTEKQSLQFVQRIADNNATTANILASGDFTLKTGSKEITVPAKLSMRKDECIRIQLLMPILRSELARIEFTPDYVLLIDRYHKEYIKASYSEVSFLANNGISFYSLQSLFWNQLTAPGAKHLSAADLKKFAADITATGSRVDAATALIQNADISYRSAAHGTSSLAWSYDDFKTVGAKKFPMTQQFGFNTNYGGKNHAAQVTLQMSAPKTSADWDAKTEVSPKYRKVEVDELLRKITSLQ